MCVCEGGSVVFKSASTPGGRERVSSEHSPPPQESAISPVQGELPPAALGSLMIHGQVGKEFPDMRQNERRIKFTRMGDAVRTSGQLTGEPSVFASLQPIFIVSRQRKFLLKRWH